MFSTGGHALPVFDVDVEAEVSRTCPDIAQAGLELFLKNQVSNVAYRTIYYKRSEKNSLL